MGNMSPQPLEASAFGGTSLQPPLSQTWIHFRKWSCYFGDLNGQEKAAIRWLFEIEIGGEGDQKFCELISGITEVLGIAKLVQIAK